VLIVDATILMPDRDAGSLRMFNLIKVLQGMGFAVTFIPSDLSNPKDYVETLQQAGIQVACLPHVESVESFLQAFGAEFELCIVSRPDTAEKNLDLVKLLCPNSLVLYDTVDVHFLRRERELRLTGVAQSEESIKKRELRAVSRADGTIAVSEFDRGKLLEKVPNAQIHVVSLIHEAHPQETPFSDRNGILFIGGFQHGPNADAVLWFLTDIFPIVRSWIPDLRFHIIGTNPPDEIRDRACDHIIVEGFVENVEEQFASRRLSIAPLRYGSGVKGKINQSMAYGLPCVATPAATEGMDLKWGSEIMVAETAHEFAEAVAKLYESQELWTLLARNSVASIERSYSAAVAEEGLGKILKHHGRDLPNSRR
jgi:glycosyltransferase involved in cell wall biosynthesis